VNQFAEVLHPSDPGPPASSPLVIKSDEDEAGRESRELMVKNHYHAITIVNDPIVLIRGGDIRDGVERFALINITMLGMKPIAVAPSLRGAYYIVVGLNGRESALRICGQREDRGLESGREG